jgi:hypothetical protein
MTSANEGREALARSLVGAWATQQDEHLSAAQLNAFVAGVHAALAAEPAVQPLTEPVAWQIAGTDTVTFQSRMAATWRIANFPVLPLYASPIPTPDVPFGWTHAWHIYDKYDRAAATVHSEDEAIAEQAWQDEHNARFSPHRILKPTTPIPTPGPTPAKLWLWQNFVDGRPEYWAFDSAFPLRLDSDDPQTLGEPVGYALVKPSRPGRADISEAEVLKRIAAATPGPIQQTETPGLWQIRQALVAGMQAAQQGGELSVDERSAIWNKIDACLAALTSSPPEQPKQPSGDLSERSDSFPDAADGDRA